MIAVPSDEKPVVVSRGSLVGQDICRMWERAGKKRWTADFSVRRRDPEFDVLQSSTLCSLNTNLMICRFTSAIVKGIFVVWFEGRQKWDVKWRSSAFFAKLGISLCGSSKFRVVNAPRVKIRNINASGTKICLVGHS
jgi:hypothetical protein